MTLPIEEMRSIMRARRFLFSLLDNKRTPRVPTEVRKQAGDVLKHYPYEMRVEELYGLRNGDPHPQPSAPSGPNFAVRCPLCLDFVPMDIGLSRHKCGRPSIAHIQNLLRWIRTASLDKRFTADEARMAVFHQVSKMLERMEKR